MNTLNFIESNFLLILIASIACFVVLTCMAISFSHKQAKENGRRYNRLPIYRTVERENKIIYILGNDSNSIEVEKNYYEMAIDRYNKSMK